MEFEWGPAKNAANIAKHGLHCAGAEALFENDAYAAQDSRKDGGAERWRGIGELVVGCWWCVDGSEPGKAPHHLLEEGA